MVTGLLMWSWVLTFLYVKNLPILMVSIGMHGTVWLFAVINISLASVLYFIMPETRGKSMEQIVEMLRDNKLK